MTIALLIVSEPNFPQWVEIVQKRAGDRRGVWRATVSDRRISADRPSGMSYWGGASGPHRRHERTGAQDGDYSLQIVSEHMEAHLGSDLCEGFGPKVGGAHPGV